MTLPIVAHQPAPFHVFNGMTENTVRAVLKGEST